MTKRQLYVNNSLYSKSRFDLRILSYVNPTLFRVPTSLIAAQGTLRKVQEDGREGNKEGGEEDGK